MNDVFISYRRADTNFHARQLCDVLRQHLGEDKVFMDKDDIPYGQEFLRVIADRLSTCAVFLAVMGLRWFHPRKGQRPRLFEPNDTLRVEVLIALNRPILVMATSPAADNWGNMSLSICDEPALVFESHGKRQRVGRQAGAGQGGHRGTRSVHRDRRPR